MAVVQQQEKRLPLGPILGFETRDDGTRKLV
jgi:hypothetical protein